MAIAWHPDKFLADLDKTINKRLDHAGRIVATEAKRLIRLPKSGADIQRNAKGKKLAKIGVRFKTSAGEEVSFMAKQTQITRRSAPGEPPAWQTGTLGRSVFYQRTERHTVIVGVPSLGGKQARYGFWLEVGTSKMAPRPYLRPALANKRDEIKAIFRGERD